MTEKLYYRDPYQREFSSRLIRQEEISTKQGPRWKAVLASTCFYPAGGGQPSDKGTLNDNEVVDVQKEGDEVVHILETPLDPDTIEVFGRIEPMHRRHFMQQHTGQHIISAVLQKFGRPTKSVHLGEAETSVESEGEAPTPFELIQIEDEVNRIICSNLRVDGFFVDDSELHKHNLRRSLKAEGNIRLVEIEGVDKIGCGGVHLQRTGEVRLIKHTGTESVRGNCRLSFVIGDAAVADYREKSRISARLTEMLSAPRGKLLERLGEYREKTAEREGMLTSLKKTVNSLTAESLLRQGEELPGGSLIAAVLPPDRADQLREIAELLPREKIELYGLLCAEIEGTLRWVICAPEKDADFFKEEKDRLLSLIKGKGGGRPPFWQGSGTHPEGTKELIQSFKERVKARLRPI